MSLELHHMSEGGCYGHHSFRDMAALSLLQVAYKLFSEATVIKNIDKIENCVIYNGFDIREFSALTKDFDPPFMDAFRIATCFENMFKAELLCFGYVVHKINKGKEGSAQRALHKRQDNRPIKLQEVKKLSDKKWPINERFSINCLSTQTIELGKLISEKSRYKNSLRLSKRFIDAMHIIKNQRNTVHFVVNDLGHYNKDVVNSYIYLKSFVNKRLLKRHNEIVQRWEHLKTRPGFALSEI